MNDDYSHNLRIYEKEMQKASQLEHVYKTNRDTFTYHHIIFIFFFTAEKI